MRHREKGIGDHHTTLNLGGGGKSGHGVDLVRDKNMTVTIEELHDRQSIQTSLIVFYLDGIANPDHHEKKC